MVLIIIFSNYIFGIIISIQMKDLRIIVSYQEQIYALKMNSLIFFSITTNRYVRKKQFSIRKPRIKA